MNKLVEEVNMALVINSPFELKPRKDRNRSYVTEGEFMSSEVSELIRSYKHWTYDMTDKNTQTSTQLHFFESIPRFKDHKFLAGFVSKLYTVFDRVFHRKLSDVHIVFANVPIKKTFPKRHCVFQPIHINSGYSIIYHNTDTKPLVVVYRKDEMCKVLIHELFHLYRMHPFETNKSFDKVLTEEFRICNKSAGLNIYEGYVEFMTTIVNMCMHKHLFRNITVSIDSEINHSRENVERLFRFTSGNGYLKQNTNVFSYIVIKHVLLVNRSKVFSILKNDYSVTSTKFEKLIHKGLKTLYNKYAHIKYQSCRRHVTLNLYDIFKIYLKNSTHRDITI